MARIQPIEESEASGVVLEVFNEMKALRNMPTIPPIWRAMARRPQYLKTTWDRYKAVMLEGSLPLLTKEIVALAVSAAHNCDY